MPLLCSSSPKVLLVVLAPRTNATQVLLVRVFSLFSRCRQRDAVLHVAALQVATSRETTSETAVDNQDACSAMLRNDMRTRAPKGALELPVSSGSRGPPVGVLSQQWQRKGALNKC